MLYELLKHMQELEFDDSELEEPVSLNERGSIATVRDLLAERAPVATLALFRIESPQSPSHVRPIETLEPWALRRVACELLKHVDSRKRVIAPGLGSYSPSQLIDEIERGTAIGTKVVQAVRSDCLLIEQAIATGKARPKRKVARKINIPEFTF
jgi:hypothetical protein